MKSFNKCILIGISILFLTTNLYGIDWDFENPNGRVGLITFGLNWDYVKSGEEHEDYSLWDDPGFSPNGLKMLIPITNWFTFSCNIHEMKRNCRTEGIDNEGNVVNYVKRNFSTFHLDFHLPLYKLWE